MIRSRGLLVLVVLAAMLAVIFSWNPQVVTKSATQESTSATQESTPRVVATRPATPAPSSAQGPSIADPQPAPRAQPPELAYSFLGRTTEGGVTFIVLHGAGRMHKVRGPGPLDDNYVIDEIRDDHLVLRHLPTGAQQVLALESRNYGVMFSGSAADTPQD